jgi:acetyl esterase/lipase
MSSGNQLDERAERRAPGPPAAFSAPPRPERREGRAFYRNVCFARADGYRPLLLDLVVPEGRESSDRPALVWIHGGAWLGGSPYDDLAPLFGTDPFESVLEQGFALARIQYRLSAEARFPTQLHDVKAAVRWLRHFGAQLGIDPDRLGVWGASAGGHLALLAALTAGRPELEGAVGLTEESSELAACASWFGPTEFITMTEQAPPGAPDHDAADSPESRLIGAPLRSAPELAAAASPVSYVGASAPPVLLAHGTDDRIVPYEQSVVLVERLQAVGAPVTLLPVPSGDHGFVGGDAGVALKATIQFFARELSPVANR